MPRIRPFLVVGLSTLSLAAAAGRANGQDKPWDLYADALSSSTCDVVNAGNAELVVLRATGQLVLVTGTDVTLTDTLVDESGAVFFDGEPAGLIDFATDGDGFRTLWWLTLTGTVVDVDGFTGQPTETGLTPYDFTDVPCDACEFWDDPAICPDIEGPRGTIRICGVGLPMGLGVAAICLVTVRLVHRSPLRRRG